MRDSRKMAAIKGITSTDSLSFVVHNIGDGIFVKHAADDTANYQYVRFSGCLCGAIRG